MSPEEAVAGLPVVLIFNVDPAWSPEERDEVVRETRRLASALEAEGFPVTVVPIDSADITAKLEPFHPDRHIVFNWCECLPGVPHSEALVAERLESINFTFTGADSRALSLSQDKRRVKALLSAHSIPTPAWAVYERAPADDWDFFPAIVKPVREHCSVGITSEAVVINRRELSRRIGHILETYRQPALVEDFIDGREFRASFWGNSQLSSFPVVEMGFDAFPDLRDRLCTYDSKFNPSSRHYNRIETLLPAPLREEEILLLHNTAAAAYRITGCRDYGRIDLRLRGGVFHVLDINPNPDLCADASMACAAEAAGFSYGILGSCLVALAACRHPLLRPRGIALLTVLEQQAACHNP